MLYLPKWRYFQEWRRRRIFPLFLHHSTCFASGCPHYLEGMRSLSLPAGNPFPAQQLRSGGGRLPSRYEHLWTDKNPAGSIVTAEMELASSFIRILRSHSLPPPSLSPGSFSSALSPRLAEMPPAAPPLAERTFPSERRVPLPGGSPLRDDWPPRRADLLLSPVLCARWSLGLSCGTILDTAPVRVRRALVRHSEPAPPNHFHLTPGTVSSLRRHAILSPLPVRDGGVVFSLADNGSLLVLAVRRAYSCSPRQSIDVEGRWVTEVTIITEEHFSRFPL